jgi:ribulose-5-phosphate 4-epimerase/fuculose-1-phosphate aldolase
VVVDHHHRGRKINFGALQMASIIFQTSPEVGAVIHSHSPSVMTLMAMGQELQFVSEPSFLFWNRTSYLHGDYFFSDSYADRVAKEVAAGSMCEAHLLLCFYFCQ